MDGKYTDRRAHGGQCTISNDGKQTAEWRVDLGSVVSISRIDIYYRIEGIRRFHFRIIFVFLNNGKKKYLKEKKKLRSQIKKYIDHSSAIMRVDMDRIG